jgi:glycosyltransferase involved in cell wall biosynthesis
MGLILPVLQPEPLPEKGTGVAEHLGAANMERLRILHILPRLTVSGAEKMAACLMISLSRSHDVGAISLYPSANSTIESDLSEAGIPVWHLGKRAGFDPAMFLAIDKVLRTFRPDVVHTHLSVLRYAMPGLVLRRVPLIVHTVHNMAEHEVDRFGRLVHRFAFRWNVLPVGISRVIGRSIEEVYGTQCRAMIPNGIPVKEYGCSPVAREAWRAKQAFNDDSILFMFVGRLDPQKNPLMLINAFRHISDTRSHLVLIGDGLLLPDCRQLARANGLSHRVHFLGERYDIAEALSAADVFVLASDWEGNPLSVMEAMASGLPVIATAVGGVPELIEDIGVLVNPGDCVQFSNEMQRLLQDPSARAAMGCAARARAFACFRAEQMIDAYETLYKTELGSYAGQYAPEAAALAQVKTE